MLVYILCIALAAPLFAQEVFRWVDDDGVVHYSDRPREGAEIVELQKAQTFSAPRIASRTPADSVEDPDFSYDGFAIVKPGAEENIWNTSNQIDVSLALSPRLASGHEIQFYVDGQLQKNVATRSLDVTLSDIWRGTHQLIAEVRGINGKSLIRSAPVTFTVKDTSGLNPLNQATNPPVVPTPSN
jgi:hypothetical protein